jgi:hypothetical protein
MYARAMAQPTSLRQIMTHRPDMTALTRQPGWLFENEVVWARRKWKKQKGAEMAPDEEENGDGKSRVRRKGRLPGLGTE